MKKGSGTCKTCLWWLKNPYDLTEPEKCLSDGVTEHLSEMIPPYYGRHTKPTCSCAAHTSIPETIKADRKRLQNMQQLEARANSTKETIRRLKKEEAARIHRQMLGKEIRALMRLNAISIYDLTKALGRVNPDLLEDVLDGNRAMTDAYAEKMKGKMDDILRERARKVAGGSHHGLRRVSKAGGTDNESVADKQ